MHDRYTISGIGDILALTPEQRERCCIDLLALGRVADTFDDPDTDTTGLTLDRNSFVWVDDELTETVSGAIINGEDFKCAW
jgi:hypothetical protein